MDERITLEKIDVLRDRAGISYGKAYEILKEAGGDVVQALIRLEAEPRAFTERIQVQGTELVARVRQIIREGNVNRITIRRGGKVLLDIPVTVGAVGAVFMPYLAALGVIAALATRCTIEVERRPGPGTPGAGGSGRATGGSAGARSMTEDPIRGTIEAVEPTASPLATTASPITATPPAVAQAGRLETAGEPVPRPRQQRPGKK